MGSMSKLMWKAGALRNVGKRGYRFHFSLHVETVGAVIGASEIVVALRRNGSLVATKPARVDRRSRSAQFCGQVLERDVTLYKRKVETLHFEEKMFQVEIRRAGNEEVVLGRIDLNLAEFVDVPTFSKRVAACLSNGSRIVMRVQSTYIEEIKTTRKRRTVRPRQRNSACDVVENGKSDSSGAGDCCSGITMPCADEHRRQEANCGMKAMEDQRRAWLHAQLTKACDVNRLLKERNHELAQRQTELEHKSAKCVSLEIQNAALRRQACDLREQLAREPAHEDMLEDLLQTKLAVSVVREELNELWQAAGVCGLVQNK